MQMGLDGKRALVTGSSSGIGEGIATMLAREGCRVVIHGLDLVEAQSVASKIGDSAIAVSGDLTTNEGADAICAQAVGRLGGIDILVNNAGGAVGSSALAWEDVDEETWLQTYQLNVLSAVRMVRRLLPAMKQQGWGRIIQIASVSASQPLPTGPDYGCAKAAVANLSVSLARTLGNCGVTANTVSPGTTMTPSLQQWIDQLSIQRGWTGLTADEIEQRLVTDMLEVPVGRIGRPEQIAAAVCLLASTPAGDYMTGSNIRVDGGQNRSVN